jgi:hypothetical protein
LFSCSTSALTRREFKHTRLQLSTVLTCL